MSDQLDFLITNLPHLLFGYPGNRPGGLLMSVLLALGGVGVGFVVAVVVGGVLDSRFGLVRGFAKAYVHIFRSVPLILLLLLVHQLLAGGRLFGFESTPVVSALVALVLYSSSYQADIIRSGLRAVPDRVVEDARLMGASRLQVYGLVKLTFSLRVMQPALTGQAITVFKDTSVVVILGVADLTTNARLALGADVGNAPFWVTTYLTVGALYFAVAFGLSRLAFGYERRIHGGGRVRRLSRFT